MANENNKSNKPKSQEKINLDKLVKDLPEVYQPIFGHPGLSTRASRKCEDRLAHIKKIYEALESKLNRPLRVLDLGCAQGFFSLNLAKLGATVLGVDYQTPNVTVCKALAAEHPNYNISFRLGLVEEIIVRLEQGQYDIVLGLSVFHHLIHRLGLAPTQAMISILANKTVVGIFEMATASEPLDWAISQPKNPRHLLQGYAFVHRFAQNSTHLSAIDRPLYIASNHYWFLNDQVGEFETWATESHAFANNTANGTRRYFFSNSSLTKVFNLESKDRGEINLYEHNRETAFLNAPPANFKTPRVILQGQNEHETWLVRERLPGELLLDKIRSKHPYNAKKVLLDTLEQLEALEAGGLYHSDLRIWNVLIDADEHATLIDYGAISKEANDCGWPYNIFLSFMIFVREVISSRSSVPDPIRQPSFNPEGFPEPYRSIFLKLFELNPKEWSFALLHKLFMEALKQEAPTSALAQPGFSIALQAVEDACQLYQKISHNWQHRAYLAESMMRQLQKNNPKHPIDGKEKTTAATKPISAAIKE